MGDTWVVDITHYPPPDEMLGASFARLRRIAIHLGGIVAAASLAPAEEVVETGLRCWRRPRWQPCPGFIDLERDAASEITWQCIECDDNGYIGNWRGSYWDFSRFAPRQGGDLRRVELTPDEYQALRSILTHDAEQEAILYAARRTSSGLCLAATSDAMERLLDGIAGEANDRPASGRRRLLESGLNRIEAALTRPQLRLVPRRSASES